MPRYSDFLRAVQDDHSDAPHMTIAQEEKAAFVKAPIYTVAVESAIIANSVPSSSPPTGRPPSILDGTYFDSARDERPRTEPQYGLIGVRQEPAGPGNVAASEEDRLVLSNMNIPWSAFICGSQGSGKSQTLACLLENALLDHCPYNMLPHPLAGLVMCYKQYPGMSTTQICETSTLCLSGIPVTVLVPHWNGWNGRLPGLQSGSLIPKVMNLVLYEDQIDKARLLKLMGIDTATNVTPFYTDTVLELIRTIELEGHRLTFSRFREQVSHLECKNCGEEFLKARVNLVDCMVDNRPADTRDDAWAIKPGTLTIVDLSGPRLTSTDACALFSVCLSIFLEQRVKCDRVVALDDAQEYLAHSEDSKILANDLLSVIRLQRHTNTRVYVSTQEPTLWPEFMDLANATFVHHFSSPSWYEGLKKHLAGANKEDHGDRNSPFDTIIALRPGEVLLFCPTARVDVEQTYDYRPKVTKPLGNGYAKIKIRKRCFMYNNITANFPTSVGGVGVQTINGIPTRVAPASQSGYTNGDSIEQMGSHLPSLPSYTNSHFHHPSPTHHLREEIKLQAQLMIKRESSSEFLGFTQLQEDRLHSTVEDALQVPVGWTTGDKIWEEVLEDAEFMMDLATLAKEHKKNTKKDTLR
ncbi:hypothetical protein F4781DRAFT_435952 [Annulohypoxylon bovei var. microspora]|nr:hypothetical protein F4781DRAFT_435952 [Annulohypoxylon bovei var. microspora]